MIAIFTVTLAARVDDQDEAFTLVGETEKAMRLGLAHALEQRDASEEDLEGLLAVLPVSVHFIPDAMVDA